MQKRPAFVGLAFCGGGGELLAEWTLVVFEIFAMYYMSATVTCGFANFYFRHTCVAQSEKKHFTGYSRAMFCVITNDADLRVGHGWLCVSCIIRAYAWNAESFRRSMMRWHSWICAVWIRCEILCKGMLQACNFSRSMREDICGRL
jgi:hypothetical protein